jgi:putative transcriptional regulator
MTVINEDFDNIMAGLAEVKAIREGTADPATYRMHRPQAVDVKAIRKRSGLTQVDFARRFGFTAAAVRDWEQNRRTPEAAARVLLMIIDREPEAVQRALRAA